MTIPGDEADGALPRALVPDDLTNRLATVELRLRQLEVPPPDATPSSLGALRPVTSDQADDETVAAAEAASPGPSADRPDPAADMVQVLSEMVEQQRARAVAADQSRQEATVALGTALLVERWRRRQLEAALTRTYSQAQALQGVVGDLQASRSYRLGHRLARLAGRPGPVVTSYATPIAENVDPADVAEVQSSGLFNAEWYLATYPDVAASGADPLTHFMTQARAEHRCPGPYFDTGWYLRAYGEDIPEGTNPLAYYLTTGWRQGQRPWENFDPEDYLRQHPEAAELDTCPLVHLAARAADELR
jgi:hypothetical protein